MYEDVEQVGCQIIIRLTGDWRPFERVGQMPVIPLQIVIKALVPRIRSGAIGDETSTAAAVCSTQLYREAGWSIGVGYSGHKPQAASRPYMTIR